MIGKDGWGQIWTAPYSGHSSYEELKSFVRFLRPARVVATVVQPSCPSRFRDLVATKQCMGTWLGVCLGALRRSEGVGRREGRLAAAAAASSSTTTATTPTGTRPDGEVARENTQAFDPCLLLCGKSFSSQSQLQSQGDSCLQQQQSSRKRPRSLPPRPSPLSASQTTSEMKPKNAVTATTTTAKQTTLFQFFKGADRT
ncbi:hypothetical protein BJ742DRAFT_774076 [Cladochytrium replicatum]|nr:hypothetical protein BJ742DRAFT_774076 [Cladochytrium replicatum]